MSDFFVQIKSPDGTNLRERKIVSNAAAFFQHCLDLMLAKSHDYTADSDDPWRNFRFCGWKGIIPRIGDKYMRLVAAYHNVDMKVAEDKLESDLIDIANYAMIMWGMIQEEKDKVNEETDDTPKNKGLNWCPVCGKLSCGYDSYHSEIRCFAVDCDYSAQREEKDNPDSTSKNHR